MKKHIPLLIFCLLVFLLFSCDQKSNNESLSKENKTNVNPAAKDFDIKNSDPKAIQLADEVMAAMGGRHAYDTTRYISWNFFGSRILWWDKHSGDVRIESQRDNFKLKMNIHDMTGEVMKDSITLTHPDSLNKYLERGKNLWINDSYWLVMPFKLKDSGVTLTYAGAETSDTLNADILELRFKDVGKTPQNKYQVYIDKESKLINQWAFFTTATNDTARFKTPWKNYKSHGDILLSGDRGSYKLTDIKTGLEVGEALNAPLD